MLKLDNKGTSILELLVSIALLSVFIIFFTSMIMSVVNAYNENVRISEFEILKSNFISAIGKDINSYGVCNIEKKSSNNSIIITYGTFRESKLNELIKKELKAYQNSEGKFYLSYQYYVEDNSLTSKEKIATTVREIKNIGSLPSIKLNYIDEFFEIKVPIVDFYNTVYDINIYGKKIDCSNIVN